MSLQTSVFGQYTLVLMQHGCNACMVCIDLDAVCLNVQGHALLAGPFLKAASECVNTACNGCRYSSKCEYFRVSVKAEV